MTGGNGFGGATCPHCNALRVLLHAVGRETELNCSTDIKVVQVNLPYTYVDFGILRIRSLSTGRTSVISYDKTVFEMMPHESKILHHGQWIGTLAAIQADLAERFGVVGVPPHRH